MRSDARYARDRRMKSLSMTDPVDLTSYIVRSCSNEYIFVTTRMEELCANTRPGSNGGRKQIGMFLAARARTFVALSRPSIINQRILASARGICCDARVSVTHENEINDRPAMYYEHSAEVPDAAPLSRR